MRGESENGRPVVPDVMNCAQHALHLSKTAGFIKGDLSTLAEPKHGARDNYEDDHDRLSYRLEGGQPARGKIPAGDFAVVSWPHRHTAVSLGDGTFSSHEDPKPPPRTAQQLRQGMIPKDVNSLLSAVEATDMFGVRAATRNPGPDRIAPGLHANDAGAHIRGIHQAIKTGDEKLPKGTTAEARFAAARETFERARSEDHHLRQGFKAPVQSLLHQVFNPTLLHVAAEHVDSRL